MEEQRKDEEGFTWKKDEIYLKDRFLHQLCLVSPKINIFLFAFNNNKDCEI